MDKAAAEALLGRLEGRGVRLQLEGEALRVSAPKGVLDDKLRAELTANKPQLIALLAERSSDAIKRVPRDGVLPVSAAQQRLWFLDQVDPGNAAYNIVGAMRLRGPLDIEALEGAYRDLIARHDSLRTRIGERAGAPLLEISDEAGSQFEFSDLADLGSEGAERGVLAVASHLSNTAFDMAKGPLSKLVAIRLAPDHHVLVSGIHHIVSDGWSLRLMLTELFQTYQARLSAQPSPLAPLTISPIDHAGWERDQAKAHRFDRSLDFWKQTLQGAPALLDMPTDRPRPAKPSFRGARLQRFLAPELIAQVKARAQQQTATVFMALMTCWQAVLHRYSGQDDIVIGTPLANRNRPEFEGLIGCLINNVVVRGELKDNPTLAQFLDQIRGQALGAFEHGQVPFDLVVEHLNPARSMSHSPIFQVLFTHMQFLVDMPPMAGLKAEPIMLPVELARFDLACEMSLDGFGEHAHMQRVNYEFSLDLFDETTIARLHDHFEQMLRAFVADASQRIADVKLELSADDRVLLADWSSATADHDRGLCLHQLLEDSAQAAPDAPALTVDDQAFTYGALDQRANRLSRLLANEGTKRGDLVAFCLDRTEDIPVTMAAILKAGAAYVPLDPTHPSDRLRYIVGSANAACIVTLRRFAGLFDNANAKLVILDEADDALAVLDDKPLNIPVDPNDLAYVLYTSGSTGWPKGVEVEHRNVVAFLDAMARKPGFDEDDVLLAVTTPAFDISGLEIWLPLMKRGRIVMASRSDVIDASKLAHLIKSNGVTVLQATPATWRMLIGSGWAGEPGLKVLCGGEAMPRDLANALVTRVGELWNMYGPTETTIWSTISRVEGVDGPIFIGSPIANTQIRVLDTNNMQAPIGVVGELCIGGEGVARGYRNMPELTREKFVVLDPLGEGKERLYRTGDLARFTSNGQLAFVGRRDHQVKVRGFRIELGEIEAALAAQPGVQECVVIVREDTPGDQRLTAYVKPAQASAFDAEAAKINLRQRLPDYMTPGVFVVLDAMPLTPNGKIDRAALPRPVAVSRTAGAEQATDLMNPTQRRIAKIWQDLLHVDQVRLNDNFFDLGGHSLLLVKLHAQLKSEFAVDLPLVELFQRTTVSAQADRVSSPTRANDALERARGRAERLARA